MVVLNMTKNIRHSIINRLFLALLFSITLFQYIFSADCTKAFTDTRKHLTLELIAAVKRGDHLEIKSLVRRGALIADDDGVGGNRGINALEWAAIKGDEKCINALLDALENNSLPQNSLSCESSYINPNDTLEEIKQFREGIILSFCRLDGENRLNLLRGIMRHELPPKAKEFFANVIEDAGHQLTRDKLFAFAKSRYYREVAEALLATGYIYSSHPLRDWPDFQDLDRLYQAAVRRCDYRLMKAMEGLAISTFKFITTPCMTQEDKEAKKLYFEVFIRASILRYMPTRQKAKKALFSLWRKIELLNKVTVLPPYVLLDILSYPGVSDKDLLTLSVYEVAHSLDDIEALFITIPMRTTRTAPEIRQQFNHYFWPLLKATRQRMIKQLHKISKAEECYNRLFPNVDSFEKDYENALKSVALKSDGSATTISSANLTQILPPIAIKDESHRDAPKPVTLESEDSATTSSSANSTQMLPPIATEKECASHETVRSNSWAWKLLEVFWGQSG